MRLFWLLIAIVSVGMILLVVTGGDGTTLGVSNDDFASAVWLVPLLLLFSAGFLHSRRNLGYVFQTLLIWAAILLVVSGAYVFRHDFQAVGSRLFGGLIPGMAMTTITAGGERQVIVHKRRDGHFALDAEIDGKTVPMMVDTGASRVTLTARDAERAGIDPKDLSYTTMVQTANGTAMAAPVTLATVSVGGITRQNVKAMVTPEGKLTESLLGMSFLSTLTSVDMRTDELRLTN